jgi:glycosyltransferase involved in cell wall biosynthesis
MRILVVTPYFYPHVGGSERYIEELYGWVMKHNSSVQVDVVTYNTEKVAQKELYKGMTIYRVGCVEILRDQFALPSYVELWRLFKKLKKNNYDVVNAHTRFFDTAWWGWKAARYLGAKSVLTDHCASHPKHSSKVVSLLVKHLDRFFIPRLGKKYDMVTAVCQATAEFLKRQGMKMKVEVVYGGIDAIKVGTLKEKSDTKTVKVMFVGRMIKAKNPELVMKVARDLVIKYPALHFTFTGGGVLLKNLRQYKGKNIQVLGQVSRIKIDTLMAESDILVHPSEHHEGLPSVLLEAGAAGLAVVASDSGGTRELIENGVTGVLVGVDERALSEVIEELVDNSDLRQRLGKRLQAKVVEKFNWELISDNYYRLLSNLVK